ncbi:MBL fold metallo-hydrolase [Microvirga sp. VF16]|uniref:MBL fold metallo-hydrolase n=1 Tax=Microvirga sp. VF16 TaxID=2807101 RepID=UPI001FEEC9FE|nr:MBL fold metallo-hydrolase [Microvirga sp. VF16]
MTEPLKTNRRRVLGTAAVGLFAPVMSPLLGATMSSARAAAVAGPLDLEIKRYQLGSFKLTVISDGASIQQKPWETFGTDQPQSAVEDLLRTNFLPTQKFAVSYAPAILDTGSEVILIDTGFGESGRMSGSGKMLPALAAAGYSTDQISIVLLTHMHRDHIGGLIEGSISPFGSARYVANATEYDFWVSDNRKGTPAEANHLIALSNVKPLAPKMTFVEDGQEVVPGVTAISAPGHSPGHMMLHLESDGQRMVMIADTVVHYALSVQRPDWEVRFDMDKALAAVSRKRALDMIATDHLPFMGYHMPHPSIGYLDRSGSGYHYAPATYQFDI